MSLVRPLRQGERIGRDLLRCMSLELALFGPSSTSALRLQCEAERTLLWLIGTANWRSARSSASAITPRFLEAAAPHSKVRALRFRLRCRITPLVTRLISLATARTRLAAAALELPILQSRCRRGCALRPDRDRACRNIARTPGISCG